MSFLQNYWWATLLSVVLLVWAWRTWRRLHREPDQPGVGAIRNVVGLLVLLGLLAWIIYQVARVIPSR